MIRHITFDCHDPHLLARGARVGMVRQVRAPRTGLTDPQDVGFDGRDIQALQAPGGMIEDVHVRVEEGDRTACRQAGALQEPAGNAHSVGVGQWFDRVTLRHRHGRFARREALKQGRYPNPIRDHPVFVGVWTGMLVWVSVRALKNHHRVQGEAWMASAQGVR